MLLNIKQIRQKSRIGAREAVGANCCLAFPSTISFVICLFRCINFQCATRATNGLRKRGNVTSLSEKVAILFEIDIHLHISRLSALVRRCRSQGPLLVLKSIFLSLNMSWIFFITRKILIKENYYIIGNEKYMYIILDSSIYSQFEICQF